MAYQLASVSVTSPIHPAIEWVKRLLFRPFDLGRWFAIGFCAWLAGPGQPGWSGFNNRAPWSHGKEGASAAPWEQARGWVAENLYWLLPVAIAVACVVLALWVLFTWLGSRGEFMFLHCVATGRAEVAAPWRRYAREAHSLFRFRLALGLAGLVPAILLLGLAGLTVFRTARWDSLAPDTVLELVFLGLALAALAVLFVIVAKLTRDLVVPIMFLRGGTCRAAWKELLGLYTGNTHLLILYLLFQIVLAVAVGVIVLGVVLATCCVAGCLLLVPYLGTVALLPFLAFKRAYSLFYLAQLGEGYDAFRTVVPPASPPSLTALT